MRLLDPQFKYTPSPSTNIVTTWRRFGYRPTTEAERRARRQRLQTPVKETGSAVVTRLQPNKRKVSAAST